MSDKKKKKTFIIGSKKGEIYIFTNIAYFPMFGFARYFSSSFECRALRNIPTAKRQRRERRIIDGNLLFLNC